MVRKIIAALLAMGILGICVGCGRSKTGLRLVDQISVQWEDSGTTVCQVFDDPDKLQLILNKIRTLGQRFSTDTNPETLDVPSVAVSIHYTDGTQQLYQIKPDRYVRIGREPWQQANPRQVTSLRLLLLSLPGDQRT